MFKKIIIILVILSSLSLYTFIFIPAPVIKMLEFTVPLFMLFVIVFYKVYDNSDRFKAGFRFEMGLIFFAVVISMFGAYYFHKQSFAITAVTQRFIYFFIFYAFLHVLKPKPEDLIRIIVYFGVVYAIFYIIQTLIYPRLLFDAKIFRDRGTLRIFIPGSGFLFLAYLIGLSRFIKTYNTKHIFLCTLALIVFVLLGTRQVIAPATIVTILMILFSKKVTSKVLTIVLMLLIAVPAYFLFKDIFMGMFELSQKQISHYDQNIRYKAAFFYLFEFFPNKLSYIIGNGVPSSQSPYGIQINAFKDLFGYYQSDIGIIGDYSKFGLLLIIAQLSMYMRVMLRRLPQELDFIKYNFFVLILNIFISTGAFGYAESIIIICISLYLMDSCAKISSLGVSKTENNNKIEQ
jgi:hypothetical protein